MNEICPHGWSARSLPIVAVLWGLAIGFAAAPAPGFAGEPVAAFDFAHTSTAFDPARGANRETLTRALDLLHRVGAAADFEVVLLGSVTPACATPLCPEPLRLRARVEAVTQALYQAWPEPPATFPAHRLRWAFETQERPDLVNRLRLRLARSPGGAPEAGCPFTVEWTEAEWPPLLAAGAEPPWLALRAAAPPAELAGSARLRIRYHGLPAEHVGITWKTDAVAEPLHAGPWEGPELHLQPAKLAPGAAPRLVLEARFGAESPDARALADVLARGVRGIGDVLLDWPADPEPGTAGVPAVAGPAQSVRCAFRYRLSARETGP